MRLEQLTQFLEIVNTGSFSQAAKNLFIAQPSLSRSIKQLEEEMGVSLFIRKRDGVAPTPEGTELMGRARLIYRECENLSSMFQKQEKPRRLLLRVVCMHSRVTAFLPEIYRKYADSPISSVMLDCARLEEVIQLTKNCQVDYAVIATLAPYIGTTKARLQNEDIEYNAFARSGIYAAVGPQNPMYKKETCIPRKSMYPYTIVSYAELDGNNSNNYAVALDVENFARGAIRTNQIKLFYQLIHDTASVGLVATPPKVFARICEYRDIQLLELLDSQVCVEYAWIKLRRFPLSDLAHEALDYQIQSYLE